MNLSCKSYDREGLGNCLQAIAAAATKLIASCDRYRTAVLVWGTRGDQQVIKNGATLHQKPTDLAP